jgi:hypothetical protein
MPHEDAITLAYAELDSARDAMKRLDILKGYDLAKHKIENALKILVSTGIEVPIRKPKKWPGSP